jgi:hypothetical protein
MAYDPNVPVGDPPPGLTNPVWNPIYGNWTSGSPGQGGVSTVTPTQMGNPGNGLSGTTYYNSLPLGANLPGGGTNGGVVGAGTPGAAQASDGQWYANQSIADAATKNWNDRQSNLGSFSDYASAKYAQSQQPGATNPGGSPGATQPRVIADPASAQGAAWNGQGLNPGATGYINSLFAPSTMNSQPANSYAPMGKGNGKGGAASWQPVQYASQPTYNAMPTWGGNPSGMPSTYVNPMNKGGGAQSYGYGGGKGAASAAPTGK